MTSQARKRLGEKLLSSIVHEGRCIKCHCCRYGWVHAHGERLCTNCKAGGCVNVYGEEWRRSYECPIRSRARKNGTKGGRPKS